MGLEGEGGSMKSEEGDLTSSTDFKGDKVQRDSSIRIQEGGESSQDYAEENGNGVDGPRGCVDSEGFNF
jgi:hypothetical protein